ncbi:hypothetical protein Egran_05455 [Elaphomyces granulatus]|uniref:alpha-amylase n=1 Tax=Elaphomyces granulatus TaxID=519963 RepID=A0A232LRX2_9EURO|nr:hypothetical protein Egran_05455 [Elaphomyces granulatus]
MEFIPAPGRQLLIGLQEYCEGTWRGIINQLDYIQGMGFTAVWISPITQQVPDESPYGTAYHGYWQQDIYSLNPSFGTADDLVALSGALHARSMYLMVDVVANHMAYYGEGNTTKYSVYSPFDNEKYFHPYCLISNYDNQTNVEDCWLGDTTVTLPDLNTTRLDVQNIWYSWVHSLVSNYSVDGLRVDTVKHVQKDFWVGYQNAARVYCVGEVYYGDPEYTCPYQDIMDGLLNYPMYYPLMRAFQSTRSNMSELYNIINTLKKTCKDTTLLGNFIENHDLPRFANATDDMSLAKNVLAFIIFTDGIPIVYAGQEQHFNGGIDPANREATWTAGYNTQSELYKFIASANAIRRCIIGGDYEYLTYKNYPIYQDNNTIAIRKGHDHSQAITILTSAGQLGGSHKIGLNGTGYAPGVSVTELFSCVTLSIDEHGNVAVPMGQGLPKILYPTSLLLDSDIYLGLFGGDWAGNVLSFILHRVDVD